MRPVQKGASPIVGNYSDYTKAKPSLISRIGKYCSYCERKIGCNLAVEHLEPKAGIHGQPQLEGSWTNYLLACVNCNSTKGSKEVIFADLFFPDRDNTFYAFSYLADGTVIANPNISDADQIIADHTLKLVGLDKNSSITLDDNGNQIALDRSTERAEIWGVATEALNDYIESSANNIVIKQILESMKANGFFSVWLTVFNSHPCMKNKFIDAMNGTRSSGCFDQNGKIITPHPNLDRLAYGSKI